MMPAVGMLMRNDCARSGNKPTMTYSEVPIPKAAMVSAKIDFRMSLKSPTRNQRSSIDLLISTRLRSDGIFGCNLGLPSTCLARLELHSHVWQPYTFFGTLP